MKQIRPKGFIALISAIIISAVLIALVFSASTSGMYARFNALGSEYKRASLALADSCSNIALLRLAQDYNYAGGETVSSLGCSIGAVVATSVPDMTIDKKKKVSITTSAQYPLGTGSWSTSKVEATVVNPSIAVIAISPTCNSFSIAPVGQINSGQSATLSWNFTNANTVEIKRVMGGSTQTIASGLSTAGTLANSPTESATYAAVGYGNSGTVTQCPAVSVAVKPAVGECADTVVVVDRSGSMSQSERDQEGAAVKRLIALYDSVSTALMGLGSFGGLGGEAASVPTTTPKGFSGWLTTDHGVATSSGTVGYSVPTTTVNPKSWGSMTNGFLADSAFATTSTAGAMQGYAGFGLLSVPASSTITGVEVTLQALATGTGGPLTTGTLYPSGQGSYTSWQNGESVIDETGTPSCSGSDSIITATANNRESVNISLSSVPDGATITSVRVFVYDRGDNFPNGTYKTFARIGSASPIDATSTLAGGPVGGGCAPVKSQYIDLPDTVKSGSTAIEIGVLKVSGDNNAVRVGAINAIVTYSVPPTLSLTLSTNNGGSWSGTTQTTGPLTAGLQTFTVGGPTSLFGVTWTPANIAQLAVRVQNNAPSGTTVSLDSVSVKAYYTKPGTRLYGALDEMMANTSSVGSQLDIAINKANAELNSVRHIVSPATGAYPKKVLILISDGAPSSPSTNQKVLDAAKAATTTIAAGSATTTIFTVTYGADSNGQALMRTVASRPANAFTSPTFDGIAAIFDTIGSSVCPAAVAPTAPLPTPPAPPPPVPPANISIGSWQEIINP